MVNRRSTEHCHNCNLFTVKRRHCEEEWIKWTIATPSPRPPPTIATMMMEDKNQRSEWKKKTNYVWYTSLSLLKAWLLSRCAISFGRVYISWATVCTSIFRFFFSSFLLLHFDVCSQSHGNGTKAYRPMERRRYGKVLAPSPPPPASHQIHSVGVCEWQQSNRNGRVLLHIGVNNTKMRERNQIRVWLLLCSGRRTLFNSSTAGSH